MKIIYISKGSSNPSTKCIALNNDTTYNLTSNLDGNDVSFNGFTFTGDGTGIVVNGQGFIVTISADNTGFTGLFISTVVASNITLINYANTNTWGTNDPPVSSSFIVPQTSIIDISASNISDGYINISSDNRYRLVGDISGDLFKGFNIIGSGVIEFDGNNHTITVGSGLVAGGIFSEDSALDTHYLLVKNLNVNAAGFNLEFSKYGWIFGCTFDQAIAIDCHVICGSIAGFCGGIAGSYYFNSDGNLVVSGCVVDCGHLINNSVGGGGGIVGGGIVSFNANITSCTVNVAGSITNNGGTSINGYGGGGGICGGANATPINITACTVTVTSSITNNGMGGGGGICGGANFYAPINILTCCVTVLGSVSNTTINSPVDCGGGGGICGGGNKSYTNINISACSVSINGNISNTLNSNGGGGSICGGANIMTPPIHIDSCTSLIMGTIDSMFNGMCGNNDTNKISIETSKVLSASIEQQSYYNKQNINFRAIVANDKAAGVRGITVSFRYNNTTKYATTNILGIANVVFAGATGVLPYQISIPASRVSGIKTLNVLSSAKLHAEIQSYITRIGTTINTVKGNNIKAALGTIRKYLTYVLGKSDSELKITTLLPSILVAITNTSAPNLSSLNKCITTLKNYFPSVKLSSPMPAVAHKTIFDKFFSKV